MSFVLSVKSGCGAPDIIHQMMVGVPLADGCCPPPPAKARLAHSKARANTKIFFIKYSLIIEDEFMP
jgi:hypothetical protein